MHGQNKSSQRLESKIKNINLLIQQHKKFVCERKLVMVVQMKSVDTSGIKQIWLIQVS